MLLLTSEFGVPIGLLRSDTKGLGACPFCAVQGHPRPVPNIIRWVQGRREPDREVRGTRHKEE